MPYSTQKRRQPSTIVWKVRGSDGHFDPHRAWCDTFLAAYFVDEGGDHGAEDGRTHVTRHEESGDLLLVKPCSVTVVRLHGIEGGSFDGPALWYST